MPFTPDAVNEFVSSRIGQVTVCGAQGVMAEFPSCGKWISGLGLLVIFNDQPAPQFRHFVLQFLRRVEMALREYESGFLALSDLAGGNRGRWSPYFRALSHFEAAVSQLYQAYDYSRKLMSTELFKKGDGSALERLNDVYNTTKHELAKAEQPMWITDQGLETARSRLGFVEIEEMLRQCGRLAEVMAQSQGVKIADA